MSEGQAKFVWYDLLTSDTKAAESFYGKVIGWDAKDSGLSDRSYTILSMGQTMVGGMMPMPPEARAMGATPTWMGYIGVDNVDSYAEKVKAAGGSISRAPEDIPGVGRFAVAADPHGATFLLFSAPGDSQAAAPGTPGHIGWHELHSGDLNTAFPFYSGLFGWTKANAVDMGPMGIYQLFAIGGVSVGGMMTKMPESPAPFWLYYFNVDGADAAAERIKEAGGQVVHGPVEVPGGSWIVQGIDPQGALFATVAAKR